MLAVLAVVAALVLSACSGGGTGSGAAAGSRSGSGAGAGSSANGASSAGSSSSAGALDVAAENAKKGTTAWRIPAGRTAGETDLAGFADHVSVSPGQSFRLYVTSSLGPFTVTAYRLGWYAGTGGREVWHSGEVAGIRQPKATVDANRMVSTDWKPSLQVGTDGWPAGTYLLKLVAGGQQKYVPITVRSTSTRDRLVILNAVTTYEAYNTWGGYSLYYGPDKSFGTRAHKVSFDRPYDGDGAKQLLNFEAATIQRAERLDLPLAYLTSLDLQTDRSALAGARGLVSLGHDEYWTPGMRAAVTKARDAGTNLAFLGANPVYWRVRFESGRLGADRVLVGYKSAALDPVKGSPQTTAMWRSDPHPDPENSLVGLLYECFPAQGPLVVQDPGFFLFAGTGARKGSSYAGLVGTEIDRAYPISGTPANLQVVGHSPVRCGPSRQTFSDMAYYTVPSGAGVFSTGTMLWVRGVRGTDSKYGIDAQSVAFARTVTDTLFKAMAAGPMGRQHPARANLAALHESASTGNGTGGPVATR